MGGLLPILTLKAYYFVTHELEKIIYSTNTYLLHTYTHYNNMSYDMQISLVILVPENVLIFI